MAYLTGEDEAALRAEIVAEIEAIGALAGNVFNRRRQFNSKTDFIARTTKLVGESGKEKKEVRFVEVELINIEDSPDEGFADCPAVILTYNLHIFHEFADERSDETNSDFDFNTCLLKLRARFLSKFEWIENRGRAESDGLTFPELTQFGNDGFTDIRGYSKDVELRIICYDEPSQ